MFIMRAARELVGIAGASWTLAAALAVAADAQADGGRSAKLAFDRTSFGAARAYSAAEPAAPDGVSLPANVLAAKSYQSLLESMLTRSATFRRQCNRIANTAHLTVTIQTTTAPWPYGVRARTHMLRSGTSLSATIELTPLQDQVELIAHEIEHVIEQLDGVDLKSRAAVAGSGVRPGVSDDLAFETTRAVQVGRKVAEEVRKAAR